MDRRSKQPKTAGNEALPSRRSPTSRWFWRELPLQPFHRVVLHNWRLAVNPIQAGLGFHSSAKRETIVHFLPPLMRAAVFGNLRQENHFPPLHFESEQLDLHSPEPEEVTEGLVLMEQRTERDQFNARMNVQDATIASLLARMEKQDARIDHQDARINQQDARIDQQNDILRMLMEDNQRLKDENQKLRAQMNVVADLNKSNDRGDGDGEICSFCQERLHLQPTVTLPRCGHSFHRKCYAKYKEARCPLCRTPTEEEFPALPQSYAFP